VWQDWERMRVIGQVEGITLRLLVLLSLISQGEGKFPCRSSFARNHDGSELSRRQPAWWRAPARWCGVS
jgi:hypothetical protein